LNGTLNDTSVATVDSDGLITVVAPGSVEIIATQAQTPTHTASSIVTTFVVTKATPTLSGFGGESAGLSGTRYDNYYNDDPNWFATATLHGDTATSTQIQGFTSSIYYDVNYYSWQWLGTFRSAAAGTYNFCTESDDASHLWIGATATSGFTTSNAIVNNGGPHPVQTQCGDITLAALTNYPIRIQFGEYGGGDAISVYFTPPGGTTTYDGTGYFYSGGLTKTLGDPSFTPTIPTSVSPGAITYTSSNTSVATIHPTNGLITMLSGGTTTITAQQEATSNYNSATVTTTLTVLLDPMIGAMSPITKTYGVEPFTLTAPTTNSNGAITYTSSNTSVATVNATTGLVTLTGVGSTTITASQVATASYTSASTSTTLTVVVGFTVSGLNDFYFDLVAGTTFTVRTYSFGDGTDSQLWLYDSNNDLITTNDDYFALDSYISYIVPNSGRYRLRTGMFTYPYHPDYWSGTVSYIVETSWLNALTITTDEQGGSAINNAFTTTGGIISSSPGTPTRSGYTFNGWFTASSGGSALSFPYTHNQTANFTLYAQWTALPTCATGGTCVVGDTGPGGGIIFYVHPVGTFACGANLELSCKYLEAAPTTGTNAWVDENYLWSGNTTVAIGASASGVVIGTGYSNTLAIVGQSGGGNTSDRAATVTRAYRGPNGLSDWFLPSRDEVYQLHLNSARVSLGNAFDDFWSSSESNSSQAVITWTHGNGDFYGNDKNTPNAVRPIRAFGPSCANGGTCAVGDTGPGGGIVFYVHDDTDDLFTSTGSDCATACKYLEAAPDSGQVALTWSTGANQSLEVSGAEATGIGNGYQNTVDIVNQAGNVSDSSAAVYTNSYSNNGKSDWYLPSFDELNQMCRWVRNQTASNDPCTGSGSTNSGPGASGFTGEYWSSTENLREHAYMQSMDYAARYGEVKFGARMVRPIRAFG
jgi:uncharacterized repeat protein (TIGR02543 family)